MKTNSKVLLNRYDFFHLWNYITSNYKLYFKSELGNTFVSFYLSTFFHSVSQSNWPKLCSRREINNYHFISLMKILSFLWMIHQSKNVCLHNQNVKTCSVCDTTFPFWLMSPISLTSQPLPSNNLPAFYSKTPTFMS